MTTTFDGLRKWYSSLIDKFGWLMIPDMAYKHKSYLESLAMFQTKSKQKLATLYDADKKNDLNIMLANIKHISDIFSKIKLASNTDSTASTVSTGSTTSTALTGTTQPAIPVIEIPSTMTTIAPKRTRRTSNYNLFLHNNFPKVKAEHPEWNSDEIRKHVIYLWNTRDKTIIGGDYEEEDDDFYLDNPDVYDDIYYKSDSKSLDNQNDKILEGGSNTNQLMEDWKRKLKNFTL
jgi:hypothetical protein